MNTKETDWDAYYSKPKISASLTRKTTERFLLRLMKREHCSHIIELGGANSCFFSAIRQQFPSAHYIIIDKNKIGMELFISNHPQEQCITLIEGNILQSCEENLQLADVVFSTGLIEHFNVVDTAQAIQAHFNCAKPGALVIITFPTPTWLYSMTRSIAEFFNLWIFHDERPLLLDEVIQEVQKYGVIEFCEINWKTILTQGVVAVRVAG